jgi:hypothetical protein
MGDQRFYIDHDTIHDRITGKHVRTDPDFGPGRVFGEDGREECCRLLNSLAIDSAVCLKCREPHDGTQWATCEHCSVARTKKLHEMASALKLALVELDNIAGWSGSSGNWPLQEASVAVRKALDL